LNINTEKKSWTHEQQAEASLRKQIATFAALLMLAVLMMSFSAAGFRSGGANLFLARKLSNASSLRLKT